MLREGRSKIVPASTNHDAALLRVFCVDTQLVVVSRSEKDQLKRTDNITLLQTHGTKRNVKQTRHSLTLYVVTVVHTGETRSVQKCISRD